MGAARIFSINMIGGVLIVEDNSDLRMSLTNAFAERASPTTVCAAESVAEVRWLLCSIIPGLVLLDFDLPDGNALDVMVHLEKISPMPAVIGMSGVASPDEAFQLAARGVCAYLRKPFGLSSLMATVRNVEQGAPDFKPIIRRLVGHAPLPTIEDEIRDLMVSEALARAQGSTRGAARILSVSRQFLQHVLRKRLS